MKTQLILKLYDLFYGGISIDRKAFCADFGVSERTFYRYIKEINIFLMQAKRNCVLKVEEPSGIYFMEKLDD